MELSLKEGIIPALESSHALAYALEADPRRIRTVSRRSSSISRAAATKTSSRSPSALRPRVCIKDGHLKNNIVQTLLAE